MFILSLLSTLVALDFCVTAAQAHCPCWGLAKVRAYNWHSLLQPWGGSNLSYLHRWPFQDQTSAPGEHAEIGAIWFPRFQATLLGCDEMTAMPANSLSQPLVSAFLNSLYFPCNPCATRHSFFSHLTPIIFSLRRCFPLKKKKKKIGKFPHYAYFIYAAYFSLPSPSPCSCLECSALEDTESQVLSCIGHNTPLSLPLPILPAPLASQGSPSWE